MAHKYVLGETLDGGRAHVLTLKVKQEDSTFSMAASNDKKIGTFTSTFFLDMEHAGEPHDGQTYPAPKFTFSPITDAQIECAIKWPSPYKAPGADGILNTVFIHFNDLLIPHIGPLYRVTFKLCMYPSEWRDSTTVVVRKPGKVHYAILGAGCSIALLSTMGKVRSACITEDIIQMALLHGLLPENHFGCHLGMSTTDLLHYVTKFMKAIWWKGEVVSALFLDIKGAFPSVILSQLVHDMRWRGILDQYTQWIERKGGGQAHHHGF